MAGPGVDEAFRNRAKVHRDWNGQGGKTAFCCLHFREHKGAAFIRPVSARHLHEKEMRAYENVPKLKTDAEAEAFPEKELSGRDFSQFSLSALNSLQRTPRSWNRPLGAGVSAIVRRFFNTPSQTASSPRCFYSCDMPSYKE